MAMTELADPRDILTEEVILAVLPLPMDVGLVAKVIEGLTSRFPGAMARDAGHSGRYVTGVVGADLNARGCMEIFLPVGYVMPQDDEEEDQIEYV
jgi:hypothetical protein